VDTLPNEYSRQLSAQEIAAGEHREFIGGLWEELGLLQLDFLVKRGLRPDMKFLDVGCGCLRGGIHFVRYLEPGHYFGIDANESLLTAGYEVELAAMGLQERLPRGHLLLNDSFEAWQFGEQFDFALAQSVFTHLPRDWLRRCLEELARCLPRGGQFYLTYFECPSAWGGEPHPERDPFHYHVKDLRACAEGLPWVFEPIGAWNHPRSQHIALYLRS